MKKFILIGLMVAALAGCEDIPFHGHGGEDRHGGDDLTGASQQKHLVAIP